MLPDTLRNVRGGIERRRGMRKDEFPIVDKLVQNSINEVLDNIRAEINEEYRVESEHPYGQGLRRALQIIDKYKAESEE